MTGSRNIYRAGYLVRTDAVRRRCHVCGHQLARRYQQDDDTHVRCRKKQQEIAADLQRSGTW